MPEQLPFSPQEDLEILYADEEQVLPGRTYGPIIRSVYIIECCTRGSGSISINGRDYSFRQGDCYALFPEDTVIHRSDRKEGRDGFWCALNGASVGKYLKRAGIDSTHPFFPACVFESACEEIQKMVQLRREKDLGVPLRLLGSGYTLLGTLVHTQEAVLNEGAVDKIIGLMQTNYPDNLTVEKMAETVGFERSYFSTLFRKKTGVSPYRYLMKLRLRKACDFLKSSAYSVADVAEMVGLDSHNFSRFFSKEIGTTPLQYRLRFQKSRHPLSVEERTVKTDCQ